MFTFCSFRKLLLGTILLISTVSLVLSIYLKPFFIHPNSAYVLVGILDGLIFAIILAIFRKILFGSAQSVATETLGLFTLLPFALSEFFSSKKSLFSDEFTVLVLYCISLSVIPDPTALGIFAILQILMFIGAILRKHSRPHIAPLSLNILHRRSLHDRSH
jgi:hypothetical protein